MGVLGLEKTGLSVVKAVEQAGGLLICWDDNKEKWLKKFKDAGMTSNINTQIWNKEGVFRIGRIFMYKDEKAFIACQKIFREFENENSDINRKISSSRGIVLDENILV